MPQHNHRVESVGVDNARTIVQRCTITHQNTGRPMKKNTENFVCTLLAEELVVYDITTGRWRFAAKYFTPNAVKPVIPHLRWAGMQDSWRHCFKLYSLPAADVLQVQLKAQHFKGQRQRAVLAGLEKVKVI